MLPDTELLCELRDGVTLCDANRWHAVFLLQSILVGSLGLANVVTGLRHRAGRLDLPLWVARRFAVASLAAAVVPLGTGLFLRDLVRRASLDCYLQHASTGCSHSLVDRGREMAGVLTWIGWTEGTLIVPSLVGLALLLGPPRR